MTLSKRPSRTDLVQGAGLREETATIVGALGNHCAKMLTYLAMEPGTSYRKAALYARMLRLQSPTTALPKSRHSLYAYCRDSLAPAGLVTETLENRSVSYVKDRDVPAVQALCGHFLDFAIQQGGLPLDRMFGKCGTLTIRQNGQTSRRARPPLRRLRVLTGLSRAESPLTMQEFADLVHDNPKFLHPHLEELAASGLVAYDERPADTAVVYYRRSTRPPTDPPTPYYTHRTLTQEIYRWVTDFTGTVFTSHDVYHALYHSTGCGGPIGAANRKHEINGILAHLCKGGYLSRQEHHAVIVVAENTQRLFGALVGILEGFEREDADFIASGLRKAHAILQDPDMVSRLLALAYRHAPKPGEGGRSQLYAAIIGIVQEAPLSTTAQVRHTLNAQLQRPVSHSVITQYVRELERQGALIVRAHKRAKYLALPEHAAAPRG